jgi:GH15 family glucan-1,4-alpha-glucosidase
MADNFTLMGRTTDARRLFDRLMSIRNDVGLLAEEYDAKAGRQLGNFPQAFSHLALIDAGLRIILTEMLSEVSGPRSSTGAETQD